MKSMQSAGKKMQMSQTKANANNCRNNCRYYLSNIFACAPLVSMNHMITIGKFRSEVSSIF